MTSTEAKQVMAVINSSWPGKPLDEIAARMWTSKLVQHDAAAVLRVLDKLIETEQWRPSLAKILEPLLAKPTAKTAAAAFDSVWSQINNRPRVVSELEERAVRMMGGWAIMGQWQLDERHWHAKRFVEVYEELVVGARSDDMRTIASGERRAIAGDTYSDDAKARERIAAQMEDLRKRGT